MKAIRYHQTGPPDVLCVEEVEEPRAERGQVLVRIEYAGVNFADTLLRRGLYVLKPEPPVTLGFEAAGVIEQVGEDVCDHQPGDRVALLANDLYAERAVATANQLVPLPDSIDTRTGAAFPIQALTAYHLLHTAHQLTECQTVLVHAAAGGVGLLAVQMAKIIGATVIGTVSSEQKAELVRSLGADHVVNYSEVDFADAVLDLTGGRGVDLILDSVGKATFRKGLDVLAPYGNLVTFGQASGRVEPFDPDLLIRKALHVSGFVLKYVREDVEELRRTAECIFDWLTFGQLKLTVGRELPLVEAAKAHALLEGRETTGKVLLKV